MGPTLALVLAMLQSATAAPLPKPASAQAMFDGASTAISDGRHADALAAFEALEARPTVLRNAAVNGAVKARKAAALVALDRMEDAHAAALAALDLLAPGPGADRVTANVVLARVAKRRFDSAGERAASEAALAAATTPGEQMDALFWAIDGSMFDPDDRALAYADRLVALAEAQPEAKKGDVAQWRTLRARALLNHGDTAGGYAEMKRVLAARGGLRGNKVSLTDAVMRSDLAIAALLNGNKEDARKYLAYTGAGRLADAPFAKAVAMDLPSCGELTGLKPDDVAVIEFSIGTDGSVLAAQPIYVSRTGPYAVQFAEAVAGWSWRAEDAAKIPVFYRAASRVELRCTTAESRPSLIGRLREQTDAWLDRRGIDPFDVDLPDAAALTVLKQELGKREKAGAGLALLPVLRKLIRNTALPADERLGIIRRAVAIVDEAGAPIATKVLFRTTLYAEDDNVSLATYRQRLRALLALPEANDDVVTSDTLRLLIAEPGARGSTTADAADLLHQVATDTRLPKDDALRTAALVRLASLQARAGDLSAARRSYLETGLSSQQCSIVDARPAMQRSNASSSDFPMEASMWGFEGWVRTEFDVTAAGRTANQRVTVAYPPFVFRDAGIKLARDFVYQQSYRPEAGLGCGGATTTINFLLPR